MQKRKIKMAKDTTIINIPLNEVPSNNKNKFCTDSGPCCPVPGFVILISIIEISAFIYDFFIAETQIQLTEAMPIDSILIYRPDRRHEFWRFFTYMMVHIDLFHLGFNVTVQLIIGWPLEIMHGFLKISIIYFGGVLAGSLSTSIVDSEVYLLGASGGVYALLAAHLINILLNFNDMKYTTSDLKCLLVFGSCDFGYAIYMYFLGEVNGTPSVSYIAHIAGGVSGITISLVLLNDLEQRPHMMFLRWLALAIYISLTLLAIVFNLVNTDILQKENPVTPNLDVF